MAASPPLDICTLRKRLARGERFAYRYFWGHTPKADGVISDAVFSQSYPSGFVIDGRCYAWAEQWMMAEKARLFQDVEALKRVMSAETPSAAKRAGRAVRGYDDKDWAAVRLDRVVKGNIAKFEQNPVLRKHLLSTGPVVLVEASPDDSIWGIGLRRDDPAAADPLLWPGLNLLGFALMTVRDALASLALTNARTAASCAPAAG